MKCYRKNGSDGRPASQRYAAALPSMKCYRKNGSDGGPGAGWGWVVALNEVLPKER